MYSAILIEILVMNPIELTGTTLEPHLPSQRRNVLVAEVITQVW